MFDPLFLLVYVFSCTVVGEVAEVLGQFNSKVVISAGHPFFHDVKGLVVEGHQVKEHHSCVG